MLHSSSTTFPGQLPRNRPTPVAATRLDAAISVRDRLAHSFMSVSEYSTYCSFLELNRSRVSPVIPRFLDALDALEDLQLHQESFADKKRVKVRGRYLLLKSLRSNPFRYLF